MIHHFTRRRAPSFPSFAVSFTTLALLTALASVSYAQEGSEPQDPQPTGETTGESPAEAPTPAPVPAEPEPAPAPGGESDDLPELETDLTPETVEVLEETVEEPAPSPTPAPAPIQTTVATAAPAPTPAAPPKEKEEVDELGRGNEIKTPGRFGVGVALGTGAWPVSAKYFISREWSVEATGLFWGILRGFGFGISADGLYEGPSFFQHPSFDLSWQVGGGIDMYSYTTTYRSLNYTSRFLFGMHLNAGIQLLFKQLPIDVVLEYRPGAVFRPYITTTCDGANNCTTMDHGTSAFAEPWEFALLARYYF